MNTESVKILWPEKRVVSADTIKMWASDSFYNNADAYTDDDQPIYRDFTSGPPSTLEDCIEWLDSMGEVTFAKR